MATAHKATKQEVTSRVGGSFLGTAVCSCGWAIRVGPYASEPLTGAALSAEWRLHLTTAQHSPES